MSQTRNNYKAKWLAAAKDAGNDIPARAAEAINQSTSAINASVLTSVELRALQTTAFETAHVAKSLTSLMNDVRNSGGVDYGEVDHNVDSQLSKMPLHVILRRVRDVMKIAEFRIGMLSVACDELSEAGRSMAEELQSVTNQSLHLQRTAVDSLIIGAGATPVELEDYGDLKKQGKRYHRYGVHYADLQNSVFEDFVDLASHRSRIQDHVDEDEHSSDSDSDSGQQIISIRKQNGDSVKKHLKNDSGVSGLSSILGVK